MAYNSGWPTVLPRLIHRQLRRRAARDPWFEIYEVAAGIWSLVEPYHDEEVISYLVTGDRRAVLIDTGPGIGDIRAEVEVLTRLPVTVVSTHGHWDHLGGNHQFADILAFADDSEIARIEKGLTPEQCAERGFLRPEHLCRPLPAEFEAAAYEVRPSRVSRRLREGDAIDLGGRSLVVYHTPGHSPGSICLLETEQRILFTGDTYYPGTLFAQFPSSDIAAYFTTMQRLAAMAPGLRLISPSHNESTAPAIELVAAWEGFSRIRDGDEPFELTAEANHLYDLGRFRVVIAPGKLAEIG